MDAHDVPGVKRRTHKGSSALSVPDERRLQRVPGAPHGLPLLCDGDSIHA
jgi:hypothetical protein